MGVSFLELTAGVSILWRAQKLSKEWAHPIQAACLEKKLVHSGSRTEGQTEAQEVTI